MTKTIRRVPKVQISIQKNTRVENSVHSIKLGTYPIPKIALKNIQNMAKLNTLSLLNYSQSLK